MKQIEKISVIDAASLNNKHYFASLLEQASRKRLLPDASIEGIRKEAYFLLARETERYNDGNSSSVRVETAKSLMDSIFFTVSMALKTYHDPQDAVTAIAEEGLENLLDKGRKQIYAKIAATKAIHRRIVSRLFPTPNIYYRATVVDAIYGFFQLYRPAFHAQEIHITADYPTCNGVADLDGIEFIREYVGNLYYENLFCNQFSPKTVHHLLYSFHHNYQNLLINLYEPVLVAALACVLCNREVRLLTISQQDYADLERLFEESSAEETANILENALPAAAFALNLVPDLNAYVARSVAKISATVRSAAATKTLNKVILIPAYPENENKIAFAYGKKMDDDRYRQVIGEIGQCKTVENKIDVIRENIRSLADMEDVLLDADLTKEDMNAVFRLLTPAEYAALQKHYPDLNDPDTLSEKEKSLWFALKDYTAKLPDGQQTWLKKAVEQMEP